MQKERFIPKKSNRIASDMGQYPSDAGIGTLSNGEESSLAASELFRLASDLLFTPAALLFAWIVGRIEAMQRESRSRA